MLKSGVVTPPSCGAGIGSSSLGFGNVPPITEYIRCAAGTEPWLSGIGTAAISVLLGNWLWYPTR